MKRARLSLILALALVLAVGASCLIGTTPLPPARLIAAALGGGQGGDSIVLWEIRLPRALAAACAGMALGASGAALQGLLRNPLAEPGVLGVSAWAALFATVTLFFGWAGASALALPVAAILGALTATAIIAMAAAREQSVGGLILVGVGLSSLAGALMALAMNLAPNPFTLTDLVNWTLGSVANRSLSDIAVALPFLIPGMALLWLARGGLSALALGEEAAAGVGLNLTRHRLMVVLGCGLATGASVAVAGAIGFVGIVAPHLTRPRVGHDPARSVVPSALMAALILVLADIAIRLLPGDFELRLGVVAALIGAPLFIVIATRRGVAG